MGESHLCEFVRLFHISQIRYAWTGSFDSTVISEQVLTFFFCFFFLILKIPLINLNACVASAMCAIFHIRSEHESQQDKTHVNKIIKEIFHATM